MLVLSKQHLPLPLCSLDPKRFSAIQNCCIPLTNQGGNALIGQKVSGI